MDLAYCGLNCGECPIYLVSINQNAEEQVRLAKEYSTETCNFSKTDIYCLGCHSETTSEKMCGGCEIRKCGKEKPFKNCAECNNFPCAILEKYLEEKSEGLNKLKQIATEFRRTE